MGRQHCRCRGCRWLWAVDTHSRRQHQAVERRTAGTKPGPAPERTECRFFERLDDEERANGQTRVLICFCLVFFFVPSCSVLFSLCFKASGIAVQKRNCGKAFEYYRAVQAGSPHDAGQSPCLAGRDKTKQGTHIMEGARRNLNLSVFRIGGTLNLPRVAKIDSRLDIIERACQLGDVLICACFFSLFGPFFFGSDNRLPDAANLLRRLNTHKRKWLLLRFTRNSPEAILRKRHAETISTASQNFVE